MVEIWLDGDDVDAGQVGSRAALLARLRGARLPTPRAFVLPRAAYSRFRRDAGAGAGPLAQLRHDLGDRIVRAVGVLAGPVGVRRSRVDTGSTPAPVAVPEYRESYLNLVDPTDVLEAVRRSWVVAAAPVAILVQAFVLPDASAVVRPDPARAADRLRVASTYGIGDLLAAGLVVPDRHTIARADGAVIDEAIGRKAQMTMPRNDGGVLRVPVPPVSAARPALAAAELAVLAALHRSAESAVGPLATMCASLVGTRWHITDVVCGAPRATGIGSDIVLG